MTRPFSAALCALNAKYVHSSLAPWCLLAGVRAFAPDIDAYVVEGTVNEPPETVCRAHCERCARCGDVFMLFVEHSADAGAGPSS